MLPKILGIGAQKAGTSWLHNNIAMNPGAWVPPFKELHFFDHKFVPTNRRWTEGHVRKGVKQARQQWVERGQLTPEREAYLESILQKPMFNGNWYKRAFSLCPRDRKGVDVTPEYASVPEDGVEFIKHFLKESFEVIYIIRDPVSRAVSQMRMNIERRKKNPQTRAEWLDLANDPAIEDRGNYIAHVTRWQKALPEDRILFIPFGLIAKKPLDVLRRVEEFANLPNAQYPHASSKVFPGPSIYLPDFVYHHFNEKFADHVRFIETRFGKDFASAC